MFNDAQKQQLICHPLPRHIALLMDGNGRWARMRGLSRTQGHQVGAANIMDIVRTCLELGVEYLTVYIFSYENWKRPPAEVRGMLHLVEEFLDHELQTIHAWNVRLRHLGRLNGLSQSLVHKVCTALDLTQNNTGLTLAVALNYSSRMDLIDAVKRVIESGISVDAIDEQILGDYLSTAGMPNPDLIIRTSGEQRLSNFLLWEYVDALFWTTPVFWPDFTPNHLLQAIADWGRVTYPVEDDRLDYAYAYSAGGEACAASGLHSD